MIKSLSGKLVLAAILLLCWGTAGAEIAEIYNTSASDGFEVEDTDYNTTLVIPAGTNRVLWVAAGCEVNSGGSCNVSKMQLGGVNLTSAIGAITWYTATGYLEAWYMLDTDLPASGTYNLTTAWTGGTVKGADIGVILLENANQSAPEATATNAITSATTNYAVNITTVTNGAWVLDAVAHTTPGDDLIPNATQTGLWAQANDIQFEGGYKAMPTAGETTMNWTSASHQGGIIAASFAPYSSPPAEADDSEVIWFY